MNKIIHPSAWIQLITLLNILVSVIGSIIGLELIASIGNQYKYIYHRCSVRNYYCQNSVEDIPEI